jgi:hypothetical protein
VCVCLFLPCALVHLVHEVSSSSKLKALSFRLEEASCVCAMLFTYVRAYFFPLPLCTWYLPVLLALVEMRPRPSRSHHCCFG